MPDELSEPRLVGLPDAIEVTVIAAREGILGVIVICEAHLAARLDFGVEPPDVAIALDDHDALVEAIDDPRRAANAGATFWVAINIG